MERLPSVPDPLAGDRVAACRYARARAAASRSHRI